MRSSTNTHSRELGAMRNRVMRAVEAFARGEAILVGDDGRRENEADLVFHASHATPELVNIAIRKACGLLCVSVSNEVADRLGIPTSPKWPGGMSHTGFTLSIDARNNISSGISAGDRAHTISLLASPHATHHDFLSPGHVFPVRAVDGGLLARTGHTEAVMELCQLASMPAAAAMCEILDDSGEALRPSTLAENHSGSQNLELAWWRSLPYVSTVDLLWYRLLCAPRCASSWKEFSTNTLELTRSPLKGWRLIPNLEGDVLVPCSVITFTENVQPSRVRVRINNGFREWSNSVSMESADADVSLYVQSDCITPCPTHLAEFCDLSGREGLRGTQQGVRRVLTQMRAFEHLSQETGWVGSHSEWISQVELPVSSDRDLLLAAREM